MPIHRDNGFLYADDIGITPMLGIESARLQECISEVKKRNLLGVFGTRPYFLEDNLNFLNQLSGLKQLWFYELELKDSSGVYTQPQLELFCVGKRKDGVDFSRLPALRHLIWSYQAKDSGVETLTHLRQLDIWHFNPKQKSFAVHPIPRTIEHLEINWANPTTLDGLPIMPNLRELQLAYCKLESLEGLEIIAPNLERLIVQNCKKLGRLEDHPVIKTLPKLSFAFINKTPAFGKR